MVLLLPPVAGGQPLLDVVHHCSAEALLGALPDGCVDLIVTSPPYDNLRTYNGFSWDFEYIAQQSYRVLKMGGVLVWVVADATINGSETLTSFRQALYFKDVVGFRVHQRIVWEKAGLPAKRPKAYLPDFEDIFVLSKGEPATFNPLKRINRWGGETKQKGHSGKDGFKYAEGKRTVCDESLLTNVWRITVGYGHNTKDGLAHEHPAIFPEVLAERHILTWSNAGDVVLDYFGGSGTTAKMARANGRHYITCDISGEYVDLMRRRLAQPYTLPMFDTVPVQAEP